MNDALHDRPPLVRPAFRRFAIAAFAILLPIAAHSVWDYIEVRRLVREVERVQAKGEPVSVRQVDEGAERLIGRGRDAASYYLAGGMLALESHPRKAMKPVREWLASPHPDRHSLDRLAAPVDEMVSQSREALQLADAAARLSFAGFPGGTEYSYRTAGIAVLSELITARTVSASVAGRGDEAVDSAISGLQIRRALRSEQWYMFSSSDPTAAVLSLSRPSPDALLRLQSALEAEDTQNEAVVMLLRERARYLEMMWRYYYGTDPATPRYAPGRSHGLIEALRRPWVTRQLIDTLQVWAALIDVARSPSPPSAEGRAVLSAQYGEPADARRQSPTGPITGRGLALAMFTRAIDASPLIVDRCSRVAVAVERFRRDHGGALPADLSQLAPQYLASVPVDPYSRGPLLFRSSADAYTIYSVGQNEKDDGGGGADIGVRILVQH